MSIVAVVGWFVYVLVVFVVRSALHLRATGSTGFSGVRRGAGAIERFAGASMVVSFALSLGAPFVGAPVADTALLGAALVGLATAGTFAAQLVMARSWRIGVDPSERTDLVTKGPFALVRNPIFSCMSLASVGLALSCPTPLALLAPPLLALALEVQVRVVEEPYLTRTHGDAYLDYAGRAGRFVPWLGRLPRPSGVKYS